MNYIKQFRTSLIVFGLFLIFIPTLCHANMALPVLLMLPLKIYLFVFFIVIVLESLVIKKKLNGPFRKTLLVSFLINLLSTILGYLLVRFWPNGFITSSLSIIITFEYEFIDYEFITSVIILFLSTVVVEGMLLLIYYFKSGIGKVLFVAFLMNILSYILLFGSLFILY